MFQNWTFLYVNRVNKHWSQTCERLLWSWWNRGSGWASTLGQSGGWGEAFCLMYREHNTPETTNRTSVTKEIMTASFYHHPTAHLLPWGPVGSQSSLLSELPPLCHLPDSGWSWKAGVDGGPAAAASLGSALTLQKTATSAGASEVERDWEDKQNENINSVEQWDLSPNLIISK